MRRFSNVSCLSPRIDPPRHCASIAPPVAKSFSRPIIRLATSRQREDAAPYWTVVRESPYGGEVSTTSNEASAIRERAPTRRRASPSSIHVSPGCKEIRETSAAQYLSLLANESHAEIAKRF